VTQSLPAPGEFAVVRTGGRYSKAILAAQWANDAGKPGAPLWPPRMPRFDHAVICTAVQPDGTIIIVEAGPGGAKEQLWHYEHRPHRWSTGIVATSPGAAAEAQRLIGTGYSYADYAAIAAHRLGIRNRELRAYIAATGHLICSQLVDLAEHRAGCHLFDDGRWEGYCTPSDLARLLEGQQ
jgi:hypothetical protein